MKSAASCKVGDFVEIKNSKLDDGAKAAHLTYVGDSDVGKKRESGMRRGIRELRWKQKSIVRS